MQNFDNHSYCLDTEASIKDALQLIEKNAAKIALILNDQGEIIGTLTDGDIRRGILSGKDVTSAASSIMNKSFTTADATETEEEIIMKMKIKAIDQIPIVDKNHKLIKLYSIKDSKKGRKSDIPIVIMAGGKGMRLRPHTESCPKPMLKIGKKPILEHLIESCINQGFSKFYLSVNYLKEKIIEHFGDGSRWGIEINYLEEGKPMGTAGSLKLLPRGIKGKVVVMNGDILTRLNLMNAIDFVNENNADGCICVLEHRTTLPYGVVDTDGIKIKGIKEKPTITHMANAGIYVINKEMIKTIGNTQTYLDMPELLMRAVERNRKVVAYPIHEYWLDIGRIETLEQARIDWV